MDSPDRLNVLVEGSLVKGDMITDSNLRIDGEVLGNVQVSSKVVIGKTGKITGDLICGSADIEGTIKGALNIESLLVLRATAVIQGEISTSKLQVEEGANFSGNCIMSGFDKNKTAASIKEVVSEENVVY